MPLLKQMEVQRKLWGEHDKNLSNSAQRQEA